MANVPSKSPFPSVRRVITGHSICGKSTIIRDEIQSATFIHPGSVNAIHDFYRTGESPPVIDGELKNGAWVDEIKENPATVSKDGSTFRSVDFAPGSASPFHRTVTIDYGIVTHGSIVLELNNKCVTLNTGDVIVQRGTIHAWRNESTEWARMYCIMLGAKPVEVDGKELKEEFQPPRKA